MKKAKSILKKWLEFAEGIGLDFEKAQQMATEHCEQNNDFTSAKQIANLELDDVFEGHESNSIYQIIVALRNGEIKPFAPLCELEHDETEFTHEEPVQSEYECEAYYEYDIDKNEFELVRFSLTCENYDATNAQLDALRGLLIPPRREEFSEESDPDWY